MVMAHEKEEMGKNKDIKGKLFYIIFPGAKPEGGKQRAEMPQRPALLDCARPKDKSHMSHRPENSQMFGLCMSETTGQEQVAKGTRENAQSL